MSIKIEKKIVSYALASKEEDSKAVTTTAEAKPAEQIVHMHEQVKRPESLVGSTYKIALAFAAMRGMPTAVR